MNITDELVERAAIAQWDSIGGHIPAVEYMKVNPEGWKAALKYVRAGLEAVKPLADSATRIDRALTYAIRFGGIDCDHHKAWVIDQMIRALTGCPLKMHQATDVNGNPYEYECQVESEEYRKLIDESIRDDDGNVAYTHNVGIPP
jgi:hypothetical protein